MIANGDLDAPLVIALADNKALSRWAKDASVNHNSSHKLAVMDLRRKEVIWLMVGLRKTAGLGKLELRIQDVALIADDEWKPGHGVTASVKLDRKQILKIHETQINDMYQRIGFKK